MISRPALYNLHIPFLPNALQQSLGPKVQGQILSLATQKQRLGNKEAKSSKPWGEWARPQQSWAVALPQRYAASHSLPQLLLNTQRTLDRMSPQLLYQHKFP